MLRLGLDNELANVIINKLGIKKGRVRRIEILMEPKAITEIKVTMLGDDELEEFGEVIKTCKLVWKE